MFCEKCGNELEEGELFCPQCGSKVSVEETPAPDDTTVCLVYLNNDDIPELCIPSHPMFMGDVALYACINGKAQPLIEGYCGAYVVERTGVVFADFGVDDPVNNGSMVYKWDGVSYGYNALQTVPYEMNRGIAYYTIDGQLVSAGELKQNAYDPYNGNKTIPLDDMIAYLQQ
ncbi:MAG: zinc ribbon domain-containing protein [Lachnospiraceae bacterium]|nr:zinc ribbon domain-containing protein [Lachnospiraceae bacterium]